MEIQTIITAVGAFLGSAVGITIVGIVVKGIVSATIKKFNSKKAIKDTANIIKEEMKDVSFTHNIQPVVESELLKVNEIATKVATEQLTDLQVKYDKILNCLEKFYQYFDDSLVSQNKKEEFKTAIETAIETPIAHEVEGVVEFKEPVKKEETKTIQIQR